MTFRRMLCHAFALTIVLAATISSAHAEPMQTPMDEVTALAEQVGVDFTDLLGASYTTGLEPRDYLIGIGLIAAPAPALAIAPVVQISAQLDCIEAKESGHANVANSQGSGASGVLQYLPRTFSAHAALMGHFDWSPWVPWQARTVGMFDLNRGLRSQWSVPYTPTALGHCYG